MAKKNVKRSAKGKVLTLFIHLKDEEDEEKVLLKVLNGLPKKTKLSSAIFYKDPSKSPKELV